jgi:hypothetical protein
MAMLYRDDAQLAPEACYVVRRAPCEARTLLSPDAGAWGSARCIGWGPSRYYTSFRALWTHAALAVRFDATDENPWHTFKERDDELWEEEVVEVFLDPSRRGVDYAEVEVSPANVVCDLLVRTPWPKLASDCSWHWDGLESRVTRPRGEVSGDWIATVVLPWHGLRAIPGASGSRLPPANGERWKFNVFRIKRPHGPADPEREAVYSAWSVPDGPSFHAPAYFRDLIFEP